jgi:hypothetical protein
MGQMFRTRARIAALAILGLAAAGLVTTGPADASEIWCLRDFNASRGACAFPSGGDCFRAAAITGGVCERQSAVDERQQKAKGHRDRQSGRPRSPSGTW